MGQVEIGVTPAFECLVVLLAVFGEGVFEHIVEVHRIPLVQVVGCEISSTPKPPQHVSLTRD